MSPLSSPSFRRPFWYDRKTPRRRRRTGYDRRAVRICRHLRKIVFVLFFTYSSNKHTGAVRSRCFGRVRKVLKIKRQSSRGSCPGYCFRKATYYAFEPLLLRGAKYFPGPVLTIKTCRFARLRIFCVSLLTRNGSKNEIISCVPPTSKVIEHATCVVAYRQRRIVNITFWCSENIRSLVDGVETNIIQSRSLKKYKKH